LVALGFCRESYFRSVNERGNQTVNVYVFSATGSETEGDWLDGVVIALNFLRESTNQSGVTVKDKKIVLISDLASKVDSDNFEMIIKGMQAENVELMFFGPEWGKELTDSQNGNEEDDEPTPGTSNGDPPYRPKPKSPLQLQSEEMIGQIVEATEGLMCGIEEAMASLVYRDRKSKKPYPWKVALEIGPDIKVNTVGFIQVRREPPKSWKKCLAAKNKDGEDEVEGELKPDTTYVRDNELQETISPDQLIESFKYGSELVTVTDEDKATYAYEGGEKSLILMGFAPQAAIQMSFLIGDGCMVFQPPENDDAATAALSSLAHAMLDSNQVAIVRRVYNRRATPRIGALIPEYSTDDEGNDHLVIVYIDLPYAEDNRDFVFGPVYNETVRPSEAQLEAVDGLIDSMMMEGEGELKTESTMNPGNQHLYRCLAHRATNSGRTVLPSIAPHIKRLMNPDKTLVNKSKADLEKVKERFKLEVVEHKKDKNTGESLFGKRPADSNGEAENGEPDSKKINSTDLSLSNVNIVVQVGTKTPVEDFLKLLKDGQVLNTVSVQMEEVIVKLLCSSSNNFSGAQAQMMDKVIECLTVYRDQTMSRNCPDLYNEFLRGLKSDRSISSNKLFEVMEEKKIGLISQSEHGASEVTEEDCRDFYKSPKENGETKNGDEKKADENGGDGDSDGDLLDDL